MAKKSLYIFLSSLLGVMLFLLIDRIVVLLIIFLVNGGYVATGMSAAEFLAIDYISLVLVLMLGAWYGIWIGLYWYDLVYEQQTHRGLFQHVAKNYFYHHNPDGYSSKMEAVRKRIETDLLQLEDLTQSTTLTDQAPVPIKRKIIRKKAPKINV